jgi:hypothetical protein
MADMVLSGSVVEGSGIVKRNLFALVRAWADKALDRTCASLYQKALYDAAIDYLAIFPTRRA